MWHWSEKWEDAAKSRKGKYHIGHYYQEKSQQYQRDSEQGMYTAWSLRRKVEGLKRMARKKNAVNWRHKRQEEMSETEEQGTREGRLRIIFWEENDVGEWGLGNR